MLHNISATNGRSVSIFAGWVLHSISITARTIGSEIAMVMLVEVDVLVTVIKMNGESADADAPEVNMLQDITTSESTKRWSCW